MTDRSVDSISCAKPFFFGVGGGGGVGGRGRGATSYEKVTALYITNRSTWTFVR